MLDPYATASQYRHRTNKSDTANDAEITAQLTAVSRMLELRLNVAPGHFNEGTASEVRYFTPFLASTSKFRLVDEAGRQHALSVIASNGIAIDADADGSYEYTIDPAGETWVVAAPYNAAATGEPFDTLELIPLAAASVTSWPTSPRAVRVTGTWGWPSVPGMITELVVKWCRDLRDSEEAGAAGSLSGIALKTDTWRLWLEVLNQYGYPGPGIA